MQEDEATALKDRRCRGDRRATVSEEVCRRRWGWIICAGWMACRNGREGKCGRWENKNILIIIIILFFL
ncbi:S ribonuclease [Pyrus ussuriensis x Pyrus communis]|uniref:S ribonuclease n=1 Tax=Pyrus ussuriensis x Pyrus communis TaxID=2448454 RepID=A0A5N5FWW5_9ROSA|nr:S ribonuclease [Pyrus ussuriensis x Pyrus communis]